MFFRSSLASFVAALLAAPLALASDGVIEINQAAALAGGVTASDTPGFPVTIDATGSYRLTGNLSLGNSAASAIEIASSATDVQIDLGGFTISGPLSCPTFPCDFTGNFANGITSYSASELRVRAGSIRSFAGYGIVGAGSGRISDVSAVGNGQSGISIGGGEISDCESRGNGAWGLEMNGSGIVRNSKASQNRRDGIKAWFTSVVSDNVATLNHGIGIFAVGTSGTHRSESTIRNNTASGNLSDGIRVAGTGSLVVDNVASQNTGAGISMLASGSVQRNTVNNNGFGLYLVPELVPGNTAAYRDNVMNANGVNVYNGVGVNLGNNSCNGTVTCP